MPKTYSGLGLQCLYPDNWTLHEDAGDGESAGFLLESAEAAFFSVTQYPWTCSPREVVERAGEAVREEYPDCEIEPVESGLSIGDSRAVEIRFFLLDLLVVSKLRAFSLNRQTFLVQQQAEDRSYEQLEAVFDAMLHSIVQSLDPTQSVVRPKL